LRRRSISMRSWNVIVGSADEFSVVPAGSDGVPGGVASAGLGWAVDSGGMVVPAPAAGAGRIAVAVGGGAFDRRSMRAVTGSSAEECFCRARCGVASMLWAALSALILLASSETLGPSSLSGWWAVLESPDHAIPIRLAAHRPEDPRGAR
jgi:hypothetical protein